MTKRRWPFIFFILFIVLGFIFLLSSCLALIFSDDDWGLKRGDIAVVTLEGDIYDPHPFIRQLEKLSKRDDIQAVVVRIDSPGGTVSASEEIYGALINLRKKKRVVASLGTVAASGGYYVACAAEKIVANKGTITGSIGVRLNHVNLEGLFEWARVEPRILTSGRYKDLASPFRPLGAEEEKILRSLLEEMHGQFKAVVREARGFGDTEIAAVSDGRIFTGERALALGLIDEIGSLQDTIQITARLVGIEGEPKVIYPKKKSMHWMQYFINETGKSMLQAYSHLQTRSLAFWRLP